MTDAGSLNSLPETFSTKEVAQALGQTENFIKTQHAEAGIRPMRGSRKQLRFTASDVELFVIWMRERPARSRPVLTTQRSASRRRRSA